MTKLRQELTLSEVTARVQEIRNYRDDAEMAHALEDSLYRDVLTAIAHHDVACPSRLAKAALGTQRLKFCRWTA